MLPGTVEAINSILLKNYLFFPRPCKWTETRTRILDQYSYFQKDRDREEERTLCMRPQKNPICFLIKEPTEPPAL